MDDKEKAAAKKAGWFAARGELPITACPYKGNDGLSRAKRYLWVRGYLGRRPDLGVPASYEFDDQDGQQ